jgi:hypothetical protein
MKFIGLPSGKIINLEQVAFVTAPGIYGDEKPEDGKLQVHFSALSYAANSRGLGGGGGSLHCELIGEDIESFLTEMRKSGLNTDATLAALTKKMD